MPPLWGAGFIRTAFTSQTERSRAIGHGLNEDPGLDWTVLASTSPSEADSCEQDLVENKGSGLGNIGLQGLSERSADSCEHPRVQNKETGLDSTASLPADRAVQFHAEGARETGR